MVQRVRAYPSLRAALSKLTYPTEQHYQNQEISSSTILTKLDFLILTNLPPNVLSLLQDAIHDLTLR